MKVLMIDSAVSNDYSLWLCQGLFDNNIDVELITVENRTIPSEYTFPVSFEAPSKEKGDNRIIKLLKYFQYLGAILRLTKKKGADAIHFQFFRRHRIESLLFPVLRLINVKIVYTAHDIIPFEYHRIDNFLRAIVYRSTHKIIVHSNYLKNQLTSSFSIDSAKVAVIHHGNNNQVIPGTRYSKAKALQKWGFPNNSDVLLFFGMIKEYKGIDLLLEAFESIANTLPDLNLVIAGNVESAELSQKYQNIIEGMEHKNRVFYKPIFIPNEELSLYFDLADAVILPYKNIYHSGVIHMAYSYNKPLIVTDVGDFHEFVEDQKSGFITKTNDVKGISNAIITAYSDEGRLKTMQGYIKRMNSTKLSWNDVGADTKELYQNILP